MLFVNTLRSSNPGLSVRSALAADMLASHETSPFVLRKTRNNRYRATSHQKKFSEHNHQALSMPQERHRQSEADQEKRHRLHKVVDDNRHAIVQQALEKSLIPVALDAARRGTDMRQSVRAATRTQIACIIGDVVS